MYEFKYRGNALHVESVRVSDIADAVGTPAYVYSYKTLVGHYTKLKNAFASVNPLICFSMKANSNLAVCRTLVKHGAGLDIVSSGELYKAMKVGIQPNKIVYASVGKREDEIRAAIHAGILLFNVESAAELSMVNRIANSMKKRPDVALRLNPDVEAHTHKYITTGKSENKFGIDMGSAESLFMNWREFPWLSMCGVHIHIGSQITEFEPYVRALKKIVPFIKTVKKLGCDIRYFNMGGGLGIVYKEEKPQTAREFATAVLPYLKGIGVRVILEPGRFIAGNSGILVTKVVYIKDTPRKKFVIIDAAMNDLIRPALYGAYHEILPLQRNARLSAKDHVVADVVGAICESGDFMAKDRQIARVSQGEYLALMGAGAYGFTMASNYNSRRRPPEIMVKGDKFYVVRKRESFADLTKGEVIPDEIWD
jgi:diaminopimelate decarboxylase